MSEATHARTVRLEHTAMSEAEALKFVSGRQIARSGRTMDPKAQIVGEFVKSIRVPPTYSPGI
jgi:hypothetical protein